MSRKHYVAAAKIVNERIPGFVKHTEEEKALLAEAFAAFFQGDNPRFDKSRFFEACGVTKTLAEFPLWK